MLSSEQLQKYSPNVFTQGNKKIVTLHNRYQITKESFVYDGIQKLLNCLVKKQQNKTRDNLLQVTNYTYFPTFEFALMQVDPSHERCCICQFEYQVDYNFQEEVCKNSPTDIVCIGRCQHLFHKECLEQYVGKNQFMKCPVCSVIYGVIMGDQPGGQMSVSRSKQSLPGYEGCGTLVIDYQMYSGSRNGKNYPGTHRRGFLPDNQAGRKVLRLLEIAWNRKLIFTVGRSVTTGQDNVIVWNGIHHKTSTNGGSSHFGYPDPTYLLRVTEQLAAKGIFA